LKYIIDSEGCQAISAISTNGSEPGRSKAERPEKEEGRAPERIFGTPGLKGLPVNGPNAESG